MLALTTCVHDDSPTAPTSIETGRNKHPPAVASVVVAPATASLHPSEAVQLRATVYDANGTPLTGQTVTWTSADTTEARVNGTGLVTARSNARDGSVTITAASGGKSGSAVVTVAAVPVASIAITPHSGSVEAGAMLQLTATLKDGSGTPITGRTITWTSLAPLYATVAPQGAVTGIAPGSAGITASIDGHADTAAITVLPGSGPPVMVGAGDIASCTRTTQEATAKLLDVITGTVIVLGDEAYENGSYADFMNCYDPSWGRHRTRTRPSAGNHEYNFGTAAGAPGYYQYFGASAGDPTKGYYSYDLGTWHIVVINSNLPTSVGSPQEQWLRADLAAHPTVCTAAYWHHPRFSSGGNGSMTMMQPIWQALYDYGADVVLSGHDHSYERFAPQTATGVRDDAKGIREFVVGTGGNDLYSWPGNPIANSEIRSNTTYGVIKLTLWPTSYDWEFVPVAGGTFTDRGSGPCHSTTPVANQAPIANPGGPYSTQGTVTLDGSGSRDPDNNTPLTYAWDLGDGATANTATVTHTYAAHGLYTVTLTVTDAKGLASAPATTTVTVVNLPPIVNAGADQTVMSGTAVNVRATFTDGGAGDSPWTYLITWGDGVQDMGSTTSMTTAITGVHTYTAAGRYTVRVTVTDRDGASGAGVLIATVLDANAVQVFTGASNIATCGNDNDELTAQILDTIPGSVFTLGDAANPSGTATTYSTCYGPTWGRHKARTYPVSGNHDYDVSGAAGYFAYFGAAAGTSGQGYYSFDLGAWHIIVLNNAGTVAYGAGSAQELWLKADLAASTKQCTLAMFHYPAFFSSDDPAWNSEWANMALWNDLYAAGVEVVLSGQQYFYERLAPLDGSGIPDPARGIRSFNVGTGGYVTALPLAPAPSSEVRSAAFGVLKLTLAAGSYTWQFISVRGQTFTDSGSGVCH